MNVLAPTLTEQTYTDGVTNPRWVLPEDNDRLAESLCQRFQLPEIVGRLLANRGITLEDADHFLNPSLKDQLPDPMHLNDMGKAVSRLVNAIQQHESIVIFGDYDVDGATSSAQLFEYFKAIGVPSSIYIPDRVEEGYGPNSAALLKLRERGADLVITVDCGTAAHTPLTEAKQAGLDVIVVDHHLGTDILPDAVAVINPNRVDETSPCRNLAAAGVTFLVLIALNRALREMGWFNNRTEPDLMAFLDLVALGTICDVMPLTELNRVFVTQGLKVMAARNRIGLATLGDVVALDGPPSVYHAGFMLGPRINAGGRIGKSDLGARLLTSTNRPDAFKIAQELNTLNKERQALEQLALEEALEQAELQHNQPVIIAQSNQWHPGIIGLVAGRLKERYYRPAVALSWAVDTDGIEKGKASMRSIPGVDIGNIIAHAKLEGLLEAGGGHAMAAGFTDTRPHWQAFQAFLIEQLTQPVEHALAERGLHCDLVLRPSSITLPLLEELSRCGPYGTGNPEPRVILHHARLLYVNPVGRDHLQCQLGDGGQVTGPNSHKLKAMAFRSVGTKLGDTLQLSQGRELHVAGKARINHWQGIARVDFTIEDVIVL